MKTTISTIIILLSMQSFGQSFEGTITYIGDCELLGMMSYMGTKNDFKKTGVWSDTIVTAYKDGDYCTMLNNSQKTQMIYKESTNELFGFNLDNKPEECSIIDASQDIYPIGVYKKYKMEKLDTSVIINDINCSIIRYTSGDEKVIIDYYYNPNKFTLKTLEYQKHEFYGFGPFIKLSNALPIKIVQTTQNVMILSRTMISSNTQALDEKLFSIPKLKEHPDNPPTTKGSRKMLIVE